MYSRFEQLLKAHKTTAYKVAKATNITNSTFTEWKKGTYIPKIDKLQRIAEYFDVSVDYLMGIDKTVLPAEQVGGLSPEYIKVVSEAKERGYSPEDIRIALDMLDIARGKKL